MPALDLFWEGTIVNCNLLYTIYFVLYIYIYHCMVLCITPQQLEKLGVLPIKLRGGLGSRPKPGTRFPKVPHKGSTLKSSGSPRSDIKVPHQRLAKRFVMKVPDKSFT